ncbi:hypothetical protein H8D36_00150 [archaeon]|nr:hypothetical protein [archaeon]MBL7057075.1 hypothetical protein [Candidatus Woesearchaeota archaeon]
MFKDIMQLLRESDLEEICGGCGQKHKQDFSSNWDKHSPVIHYKTTNCQHCGYEIAIRTKRDTSGIR